MASSVLYVTDTRYGQRAWHDPSARHRCYHFADALLSDSWNAAVVHIDGLTKRLVAQYDHVIFHRPKYTKRFASAIRLCRQSNVRMHADYDDLIVDPALASCSPLYLNGNRPLHKVKTYFTDNRRAMQHFDSLIVSTRALATHLCSMRTDVCVSIVPNSLPRLFQCPPVRADSSSGYTIGYFPGSNSHSHDVAMIREALASLFAVEPDCQLVVVGRMNPDSLPFPKERVEFKRFVDYNSYLEQLAAVDLSIAPLQSNIFNDSKSAVKLIESVAVGTPILASLNPDMQDHQNPMSALVDQESSWTATLLDCVRQKMGFDCSASAALQQQYSVTARLPLLQQHLSMAA